MFGYLRPYVPELKIQDFRTYRDYCCGICYQLRREYGIHARMMLNHDMVLCAILSDGLAGRQGTFVTHTCPRHWLRRRDMLSQTFGIRYATSVDAVLRWNLFRADFLGQTFRRQTIRTRQLAYVYKKAYNMALADYSHLQRILTQEGEHSHALALANCTDCELAATPSGNTYAALLAALGDSTDSRKHLWEMGFALGKIYYYILAANNYEDDKANGRYNIFIRNELNRDAAIENARARCSRLAPELIRAYGKLDIKLNRSLMDNILYLGLEHAIEEIGNPAVQLWEFDSTI